MYNLGNVLFVSLIVSVFGANDNSRPNFVIILMDDQDIVLNSPSFMNNLQSQIVSQGITMNNAFVSTPVCCPSRTELVSGRYYHNIGAPTGSCMHVDADGQVFNNNSLFHTMYSNGYVTGIFGKLTNHDGKYFCNDPQNPLNAGMNRVYSMCSQSGYYTLKFFNFSKNIKNESSYSNYVNLDGNDPSSYQTSQIGNASIKWIKKQLAKDANQPFIAYIGPHSPHTPYTVAPWFQSHSYVNNQSIKAPRTPNYNQQIAKQQPWMMNTANLNQTAMDSIDQIYRDRLSCDLQVDVIIDELNKILTKYNALDNTYIIYSSDHGYHLGQNRIPCEKHQMFDTDIRVPFYVKGPNIANNINSNAIIGNVDIMPTILDLAGIDIPSSVDGKSFKSALLNNNDVDNVKQDWRDYYLIEYVAVANRYFNVCGIWTENPNDFHGDIVYPISVSDNNELIWVLYGDGDQYNPGNTYRELRIINDTHNWAYAEYVNFSFTTNDFKHPYLYVLYDVDKDEYQTDNIYDGLNNNVKSELHQMLMSYGSCQGQTCP